MLMFHGSQKCITIHISQVARVDNSLLIGKPARLLCERSGDVAGQKCYFQKTADSFLTRIFHLDWRL